MGWVPGKEDKTSIRGAKIWEEGRLGMTKKGWRRKNSNIWLIGMQSLKGKLLTQVSSEGISSLAMTEQGYNPQLFQCWYF